MVFHPPLRRGLAIHVGLILLLFAISAGGLWQAGEAQLGPIFLLYLLPAIIALGLLPLFGYRAYALRRASYILFKNGIELRWGLREEAIPLTDVEWIRAADPVAAMYPQLRFYLPGAMIGVRQLPEGGQIEYLAAEPDKLIFIATRDRIFAISPDDPKAFLSAYQRFVEMVSFGGFAARSTYPAFLFNRVWAFRLARYLLLSGLALTLTLFVAVILIVPGRERVFWGYRPEGIAGEGLPAVQLFLLPVFNGLFYLADLLFGMFFFRRQSERNLAYVLWGGGVLSGILFWIALLLILAD